MIRAYLEHSLHATEPVAKLYTIGPMFRRERPQKGRFRQFHQIDVELLGLDDPRTDAEIILMLIHFLKAVGLPDPGLEINSLGCPACRPPFRKAITDFLQGREDRLCEDCRRRLGTNPLRVFDCKNEPCAAIIAGAPQLPDFLCRECRDHFSKVQASLNVFDLPFRINPRMVRGLDYYARTTFEVTTDFLGAQNAIVGGGRYDGLVQELGGPDIPGIGFAIGFERLLAMIPEDANLCLQTGSFYCRPGRRGPEVAFRLCNHFRMKGVRTEMDYHGKSLKSQMKRADKFQCRLTLILGERELEEGKAELRNMSQGTQETISLEGIEETILKLQKRGRQQGVGIYHSQKKDALLRRAACGRRREKSRPDGMGPASKGSRRGHFRRSEGP